MFEALICPIKVFLKILHNRTDFSHSTKITTCLLKASRHLMSFWEATIWRPRSSFLSKNPEEKGRSYYIDGTRNPEVPGGHLPESWPEDLY